VRPINGGKLISVPSGSVPPANAVAEIELGGERRAVPFVLYPKSLPGGLIEGLAPVLVAAADPRRFVWDFFDSFFSVSYLTPAQTCTVNGAEREAVPRFEEVR
jgi:hypothetical protein